MGRLFPCFCATGALLATAVTARAEDIGQEPLAPNDGPAALEHRGPSASSQSSEGAGPSGVLGSRGPAASTTQPSFDSPQVQGPRRRWYGWQTLIVDGAATIALLVAVAPNSDSSSNHGDGLAAVTALYVLGPPVVHAAHGHVGKAFLSLGIRAIGPLFIAGAVGTSASNSGGRAGLGVLGILAIPAAIAIDSAAIAREDLPQSTSTSVLRRIGVAPWADARGGFGLVLGGAL